MLTLLKYIFRLYNNMLACLHPSVYALRCFLRRRSKCLQPVASRGLRSMRLTRGSSFISYRRSVPPLDFSKYCVLCSAAPFFVRGQTPNQCQMNRPAGPPFACTNQRGNRKIARRAETQRNGTTVGARHY